MLLRSVTNVLKMNSMHAFLLLCLEVALIIYIQWSQEKVNVQNHRHVILGKRNISLWSLMKMI